MPANSWPTKKRKTFLNFIPTNKSSLFITNQTKFKEKIKNLPFPLNPDVISMTNTVDRGSHFYFTILIGFYTIMKKFLRNL
jgi:hypothetical protein